MLLSLCIMFKQIYNSKYKKVIIDTETGLKKEIIYDQAERAAIAKGVHLQPTGKDERRFFDTYKQVKKQPDGSIINIQETQRLREQNDLEAKGVAEDVFKREQKERMDKFGAPRKWH